MVKIGLISFPLIGLNFLCIVVYGSSICRDHVRYCSNWAKKGECSRNPGYMNVYCQRSCKSCRNQAPKSDVGCTNNHKFCSYWASVGECWRNPRYMKVFCRKSCKLCHSCKYVECIPSEWSSWSSTCDRGRRTRAIKIIVKTLIRDNCTGLRKSCSNMKRVETRHIQCPKQESCYVRGKRYRIGETYVAVDCSGVCLCNGNAPPVCSRLCLPTPSVCAPGEIKVESMEQISDSNCSCTVSSCIRVDTTINSPGCGLSQNTSINKFIIGGKNANPGDWPWMIAVVEVDSPEKIYCGASLLNSQWALSAAHCFSKPFRHDPTKYSLRVGEHRLDRKGNEVVRRIRKIILHEDYDKKSFRSDIALLFLDSPIDLSQQVKPICIEEDALISKASEQCIVTGWGRTRNELGPTSDILQELQVPIIPRSICQNAFRDRQITSSMICAGHTTGGKDSCKGDSGGPLMCRSTSFSSWKQAGIVSFGRGCARNGLAGIYTNVASYALWIKQQLLNFSL